MIETQIRREMSKFRVDGGLADSLLRLGRRELTAWMLRRTLDVGSQSIRDAATAYAAEVNYELSLTQVEYLYFRFKTCNIQRLKKREWYDAVLKTLDSSYEKFWWSILPYAYEPLRRLVCEILTSKGVSVKDMQSVTALPKTTIYKVRKGFLARRVL